MARVNSPAVDHFPADRRCRDAHNLVAGAVGLVLISLIPVALLYEYRSAAPVSDDLYFGTHTFSADGLTLLSGAEWEPEVAAGVRGYRPIVLASYWFNSVLFDDDSSITGYRLFNYGIHSLAVIAVGALAYQLSASLPVALLAALLFGVHPVHHENVVWLSGRTHSLSALFSVSALTLATCEWGRTSRAGLVLLAILVALALGSYEAALMVAPCIPLVLYAKAGHVDLRSCSRSVVTISVVVLFYLVLRWIYVSDLSQDASAFTMDRIGRNLAGLGGRLLAIPRLGGEPLFGSPVFLTTVAATVPFLLAGIAEPRSRRLIVAALGMSLVCYVPFVGLGGYSDRFAYLSSVGFAIAVAIGVRSLLTRSIRLTGRAAVVLSLLLVVTGWAAHLRLAGAQWREAGVIARTILSESTRLLPSPEPHATLRYFCVPNRYGAAHVFITYFGLAIGSLYPDRDPRGIHHPPTGDLTWLSADELVAPGDQVFRWNAAARRLEPWLSAREGAASRRSALCPEALPIMAP